MLTLGVRGLLCLLHCTTWSPSRCNMETSIGTATYITLLLTLICTTRLFLQF